MMKYLPLFFSMLLIVTCDGHGSEMRFKRYTMENGLLQETVRGIQQDKSGYLWIATEEGLSRFDGHSFVHFQHDRKNPKSLSSDVITALSIDQSGLLWVATFDGGLNYFDPNTGEATRIDPKLMSERIQSLFIDSKQRIWVGTYDQGVFLLSRDENGIDIHRFHQADIANTSITAFTEDKQGLIWVGTDGKGLMIYNESTQHWQHLKNQPMKKTSLSDDQVRSLLLDHKGQVWVGTAQGGVNRFNAVSQTFERFAASANEPNSLSNNRVLSLFEDAGQNLWVGTDGGISLFDNGHFQNIQNNPADPYSLSNDRVFDIFQDDGGIIWIGTYQGVNKWNPANAAFNHTLLKMNGILSPFNVITDIAQDSFQNYFVATYGGGVAVLDRNKQVMDVLNIDSGLPDNRVMSVLIDNNDGIWVGTRSKGIAYRAYNTKEWKIYQNIAGDDRSLPKNGVTDILQDSAGKIWISTFDGGVSQFSANGFINLRNEGTSKKLTTNKILQIMEDRQGHLWFASEYGLNRYNPHLNTVDQYLSVESDENTLSSNIAWHVFEDSKGNLWVGTQGHGVSLWAAEDRKNGKVKFRKIDLNTSLKSNTVYSIQEDERGYIWFSSNRGLSRYSVASQQIKHFDKSHGLQGYDFSLGAAYKSAEGELFFGGSNGFNYFKTNMLTENTHSPNVVLTTASNGSESLQLTDNSIVLDHKDYLLALDYIALDYAAPEKNHYQYKLQNFDKDWVDVGQLRRATYTNLPAGSFIFKVKAANNDGVWSDESINLHIEVLPAPWKTWWAYTLYALALGLVIFSILRRQMLKLASEENYRRQLEVEVEQRTSELAGQNNALQELNEKLEVAYTTDAMTGLNNRHFLESYLRENLPLLRSNGPDSKSMVIMLIDMDNLKPINDTLGHAAGDAVISHMAQVLNRIRPEGYHLIRWGGDEFMLIGLQQNADDGKNIVSSLFKEIVAGQFVYQGKNIHYGCSAGFAHYPFDLDNPEAMSWDQVAVVADKALYAAKQHEGNCWVGVLGPKREINELFIAELLQVQNITQAQDLVEIILE